MLYEAGHWIWNWLIGYGGIMLVVAVGLWLLWYFTPAFLLDSKTHIFHAALIVTAIDVASTYMSAHYFNQGYQVAINQTAANTKEAKDAINKAGQSVDDCDVKHGNWDTVSGLCDR